MTAEQYFQEHGISENSLLKFGIHWDKNRIVIPVTNSAGNFLYNKYRYLDFDENNPDSFKFSFDKGATATLFNSQALAAASSVFIVEGEIDCIRMDQEGLPAVTGTNGAVTFKQEWLPFFTGKKIYILLDNDSAGREGTAKILSLLPTAIPLSLPEGFKDVCEYFIKHTKEEFEILIKEQEGRQIKENNPLLKEPYLTAEQLFSIDFPENKWAVDRLIPFGAMTLISGLPSAFKSYFIEYMACCISQGKPVLDIFKTEKCNILFIDKENEARYIQSRLLHLGLPLDTKNIYFMQRKFLIEEQENMESITNFIQEHDINLTFIDTMIKVHQQNENASTEMARVEKAFDELIALGSAVCFIQHNNKPNANFQTEIRHQIRGSSRILGMVSSGVNLKWDGTYIEVEQVKARNSQAIKKFIMEPIYITIDEDIFVKDFQFIKEVEDDESAKRVTAEEKIIDKLEEGSMRRKSIISDLEKLNFKPATIERALSDLKKRGVVMSIRGSDGEAIYSINRQEEGL